MFRIKFLLFSIAFICSFSFCAAQKKTDTAGSSGSAINEALLIKEEQQKRIDRW